MVLGHTYAPKELHDFIYIFHMPLFFIISGYLFNFEKWKSQGMCFLKSRTKRLLFPYFALSLLVFYPFWFTTIHFIGRLNSVVPDYFKTFIGIFYGNAVNDYMAFNVPTWFLPCLFVSEIIFFLILKYAPSIKKRVLALVMVASIGYGIHFYMLLPWGADIAMVTQIFLGVGYYIRTKNIRVDFKLIIPAFILLLASYFYNPVDTATRAYGNIGLYLIGGISGSLVMFFVSKYLSFYSSLEWLVYCGKESMGILFWQKIGLLIMPFFLVYITHLPFTYVRSIFWALDFIIGVLFCLLVVYCKNRLRAKLLSQNHTRLALLLNW